MGTYLPTYLPTKPDFLVAVLTVSHSPREETDSGVGTDQNEGTVVAILGPTEGRNRLKGVGGGRIACSDNSGIAEGQANRDPDQVVT